MTSRQLRGDRRRGSRAARIAPLLAMLALAACAPMHKPKPAPGDQRPHPSTLHAPAATPPAAQADVSLASIINDQLQHGHYAAGEAALRRYLLDRPGDRAAKAILRQLTDDPRQRLGRPSRAYVVHAGDSYSTLAARYLGNAGLFLILARYNGSTDPSLLRVGQTVHLPLSAADVSAPPVAIRADADAGTDAGDAPAATETTGEATPAPKPAPAESPEATARRLQQESVTLFEHGNETEALARLDQALVLQPRLKSSGAKATSLRKDLLASFHQRAIVLYRDQHLDQAIALWDRVLSIDPDYEPAVIYRARALELKRRLKQL